MDICEGRSRSCTCQERHAKDMLPSTCWRAKYGETFQRIFTSRFATYCIYMFFSCDAGILTVMWMKKSFPILTSLKSHIFFINHGSQHSTLMILWPIKKSLKWGQCLSVLKIGSCWSELTELSPGRWSPKYLHIRLKV